MHACMHTPHLQRLLLAHSTPCGAASDAAAYRIVQPRQPSSVCYPRHVLDCLWLPARARARVCVCAGDGEQVVRRKLRGVYDELTERFRALEEDFR